MKLSCGRLDEGRIVASAVRYNRWQASDTGDFRENSVANSAICTRLRGKFCHKFSMDDARNARLRMYSRASIAQRFCHKFATRQKSSKRETADFCGLQRIVSDKKKGAKTPLF
jgi:hypothetical protein